MSARDSTSAPHQESNEECTHVERVARASHVVAPCATPLPRQKVI